MPGTHAVVSKHRDTVAGPRLTVASDRAIAADGMIYLDDGRFLFCFAATNATPAANSSWPMFRANPQHTGCAQTAK